MPLIFISHSGRDASLAEAIIQLLRSALNLSPQEIRCTSVDGYRLPMGTRIDDQLRSEILAAKVFIALLSKQSVSSTYVLLELGGRWGTRKNILPLLAPGVRASALSGPLAGLNALSCDSEEQLHQFVSDVGLKLRRQINPPASYLSSIKPIMTLAPKPSGSRPASKASAVPKISSEIKGQQSQRIPQEEHARRQAMVFDQQYQALKNAVSLAYRARNSLRDLLEGDYGMQEFADFSDRFRVTSRTLEEVLFSERVVLPNGLFDLAHSLKHALREAELLVYAWQCEARERGRVDSDAHKKRLRKQYALLANRYNEFLEVSQKYIKVG